jgi:hypothetical protein
MVRTLDFHSNNVGSIPASLTMPKNNLLFFKKNKKNLKLKGVGISFNFVSIISPKSVNNVRLLSNIYKTKNLNKKLLIKQSYMLLAWMYVLTNSIGSFSKPPKFFIKPVHRKIFTKIKAPMAHKTFSQEQYSIRYFSIKVSINVDYGVDISNVKGVNSSVYLSLILRRSDFFFETNLMLLQRVVFSLYSSDKVYMSLS